MLDCQYCKKPSRQLVIPPEGKRFGCRQCVYEGKKRPSAYNVNLNQTFVRDDKTRLTTGKAWEIEHRTVTPEGQIINSRTGRPTQR